ncbi:hypothetical protein LINPERHAP1_LOCUS28943 [Linum perenne]
MLVIPISTVASKSAFSLGKDHG